MCVCVSSLNGKLTILYLFFSWSYKNARQHLFTRGISNKKNTENMKNISYNLMPRKLHLKNYKYIFDI